MDGGGARVSVDVGGHGGHYGVGAWRDGGAYVVNDGDGACVGDVGDA